jgi:tRNA (adenine57-N1/adenine58-N1)-methyltransferase
MSSRITGGILHVPASCPSPSQRIELENESGGDAENGVLAECIQREEEEQKRFGTIEENDLVIVHVGFGDQKAVRVNASSSSSNNKKKKKTNAGVLHTSYGSFSHKRDILDRNVRFGEKAFCSGAKQAGQSKPPFVWCLSPTCELWTNVLAHRTQILYVYDISLVCAWLDLKPGKVVLESGTGSASLTHSLVRAVSNNSCDNNDRKGHVFTFEFNESRANAARDEIDENGLREFCTVTHRDIETNGFPKNLESSKIADAVFLDLPGPYKCVESSAKCLKKDGVLCSFSPCVEQVQRTCAEMQRFGFVDIKTVEMLGREFDVNERKFFTDIEEASTGKFSRVVSERDTKRVREETKKAKKILNNKGEEESIDLVSLRVSAAPRFQGQTHTGYLTFARLAPLPEGWTKASWNERAEKKREAGMDILRAKVERDEGQKNTAANARARKSRGGGGGGDNEKRKKDENVLAPSSKKTKVHPYHRADEDEYSD